MNDTEGSTPVRQYGKTIMRRRAAPGERELVMVITTIPVVYESPNGLGEIDTGIRVSSESMARHAAAAYVERAKADPEAERQRVEARRQLELHRMERWVRMRELQLEEGRKRRAAARHALYRHGCRAVRVRGRSRRTRVVRAAAKPSSTSDPDGGEPSSDVALLTALARGGAS